MKHLIRVSRVAAALVALLAMAASVSAQTTLTSTSLSAAITNAADQTASLTAVTSMTASTSSGQTYLVIDREVVGIRSINTTTKVATITRGLMGTRGTGHKSGAKVYFVDPQVSGFVLSAYDRAGACSTTGSSDQTQSATYVPVFNLQTGIAFTCLGSTWVQASDRMGSTPCTVTQATSKSTGVTCAGTSGTITANAASLGAAVEVGFTVTDTAVAAGDAIALSIKSGATADSYGLTVDAVAAGSFRVNMTNLSAGSLAEALVINFHVVKD